MHPAWGRLDLPLVSVSNPLMMSFLELLEFDIIPVCLLRECESDEPAGNCTVTCGHAQSRDQLGGAAADKIVVRIRRQ